MKLKLCIFILSLAAMSAIGMKKGEIKQGGTLSVPIITLGFLDNFNPFVSQDLLPGVMFEPLYFFNNLTGKIVYRLAESVEYTDPQEIQLTLRKGLIWSDGMPLKAADVAFSFNLIKAFPAFDSHAVWSEKKLKKVTAIDERRVIFSLEKPDSTLFSSLSAYYVLPQHIWAQVKDIAAFTNPDPVGSGPMTSVELITAKEMKLCRNQYYYQKKRPYLDCIVFRAYPDRASTEAALIDGSIDWNSYFIADVEQVFSGIDSASNHFWYPPNNGINLYINMHKAPFENVQVRRALSMAINRQAIVDVALHNYATVNDNVGGFAEYYQPFISRELQKKYQYLTEYNARMAMVLLDKAEIYDRDGDGYRDNQDGSELSFDIDVVKEWTDWVNVLQMVRSYFDDIGIKANINAVDAQSYEDNLKSGNFDMAISWSKISDHPIFVFADYYQGSRIAKTYHSNQSVYMKEINALINRFVITNDAQMQQMIIEKLQQITAKAFPYIPLFSNPTWFQYSTKRLIGWPNAAYPYVQPVWHDAGKRVIILTNLHQK